jgi:hypothetical protein
MCPSLLVRFALAHLLSDVGLGKQLIIFLGFAHHGPELLQTSMFQIQETNLGSPTKFLSQIGL